MRKKIEFYYEYTFPREGKYLIKIIIKKTFSNIKFMFYKCSFLSYLDFIITGIQF